MAYSELVKNFNRIRDYMREFYIYGFKSRNEYTQKSPRSYDNERRRVESWLGDHMKFRQNSDGKNVFLSIDSRLSHHNPLYAAWKAKSFTDGDITLHFMLLDILHAPEVEMTLKEITEELDRRLLFFDKPKTFDESTVRKKLKEYVSEGIIHMEKRGKISYYHRAEDPIALDEDALHFFSEVAPCGVIGSFLLDKTEKHHESMVFKHHYITSALDSEILCHILEAITAKKYITLENLNRRKGKSTESFVIPFKIMVSVRSGRQYLLAYTPRFKRVITYRIDKIISVKMGTPCFEFDRVGRSLDDRFAHIWGVSTEHRWSDSLEHVELTISYDEQEQYIYDRLYREKRGGTLERLDDHTLRFSADVFDSSELIPWIRTFIGRIGNISFSNKGWESRFCEDLEKMYELYGLEGEDTL